MGRRGVLTYALIIGFLAAVLSTSLSQGTALQVDLESPIWKDGAERLRLGSLPAASLSDYSLFLPLVQTSPPPGWITIASEDFEGSFPAAGWVVEDRAAGEGEYYWGKSSCNVHAGGFSGWAVGGGADGGLLACGANYPDNASSWLVYGPFSLEGAVAADFQFMVWWNTQYRTDLVGRLASVDGTYFYGDYMWSTSPGWVNRSLDLASVKGLGNLLGRPQVWVALAFTSDHEINRNGGAFVDDIILRKCMVSGTCPQDMTASGVTAGSGGTFGDQPVALTRPR